MTEGIKFNLSPIELIAFILTIGQIGGAVTVSQLFLKSFPKAQLKLIGKGAGNKAMDKFYLLA